MYKLLTIVIPCKNEEKYIAKTLKAISKQTNIKGVKIIIADASSTDNTRSVIEKTSNELGLNSIIIQGGSPAIGRNSGAKLVTTPYILFLDADITFLHKRVIKMAIEELINSGCNMLSTTPFYKGKFDIRAYVMFRINKYITWFLSKTHPFAIGGFTLVNKDFFNELGGYNEKVTQSEDWLLSKQVSPNNFKLLPDLMSQDNRRFKKYGYWNMIKLLWKNWKNRNNLSYFYIDQNYWN